MGVRVARGHPSHLCEARALRPAVVCGQVRAPGVDPHAAARAARGFAWHLNPAYVADVLLRVVSQHKRVRDRAALQIHESRKHGQGSVRERRRHKHTRCILDSTVGFESVCCVAKTIVKHSIVLCAGGGSGATKTHTTHADSQALPVQTTRRSVNALGLTLACDVNAGRVNGLDAFVMGGVLAHCAHPRAATLAAKIARSFAVAVEIVAQANRELGVLCTRACVRDITRICR